MSWALTVDEPIVSACGVPASALRLVVPVRSVCDTSFLASISMAAMEKSMSL